MGDYELGQPSSWAGQPERPMLGQLRPETFHSVTGAIGKLLQQDDAEKLLFKDAEPFRETVLQEETEEGKIGDAITGEMTVGQRWKHVDRELKEEIEVVKLNPFGVGVATAETGQEDPVPRIGYIRFIKRFSKSFSKEEADDALCSGILWLLNDANNANIFAQAEMIIPTDPEQGHQGLRFAGKLGLSAVWRAGLLASEYDPDEQYEDQPVMNRVDFKQPMDDEMGRELLAGLVGLRSSIDQSAREQ